MQPLTTTYNRQNGIREIVLLANAEKSEQLLVLFVAYSNRSEFFYGLHSHITNPTVPTSSQQFRSKTYGRSQESAGGVTEYYGCPNGLH